MVEQKIIYTDEVILQQVEDMIATIKSPVSDKDRGDILAAYALGKEAHAPQKRKSGEPYITHPIAVSRICTEEIGLGPTAVIAALLHDVVEDTPVTLEDIIEKFGEKVGEIVDGLTKLDKTYNSESPQAENFKKVLQTLTMDVRVVLIKMADRLHNMRTIGSMKPSKQLKIASETDFIYAPLAHRLGLYKIKSEFQDLILKVREPKLYKLIANKLQQTKKERGEYIDAFLKPIEEFLPTIDYPYRITSRPKSIYSILQKVKAKNVDLEKENIHEKLYDLFAIRIILDLPRIKVIEKTVCWQVYANITEWYQPIPERLKDWISSPKSNGYESLHFTVIGPEGRYVEVQVRSEIMDDVAERGFAAHWKYKKVKDSPDVYNLWLDSVREMLDQSDNNAIEFVQDFKTNLFSEEVFVFTPKGEMKVLPLGATALDFAFHIHSKVGYHCANVQVNGKVQPLSYKLKNGDQVSVITKRNQKPTEDWLKMVITGKARSKIRDAVKEEMRKEGEFGMESLMRKFKKLKVDWSDTNIDTIVNYFGFRSHIELFYAISIEKFSLHDLKTFEVEGRKLVVPKAVKEEPPQTRSTSKKADNKPPKILINGEPADNYQYELAQCCKPLQGDNIFAFTSSMSGMRIHRTTCPNATDMMANYGYRVLPAEWGASINDTYTVELLINGVDDGPGVIEKLSHKISTALGLNIRSFYIDGKDDGYFEGRIKLVVSGKNQLEKAIRELQDQNNISSVTRIEDQ